MLWYKFILIIGSNYFNFCPHQIGIMKTTALISVSVLCVDFFRVQVSVYKILIAVDCNILICDTKLYSDHFYHNSHWLYQ